MPKTTMTTTMNLEQANQVWTNTLGLRHRSAVHNDVSAFKSWLENKIESYRDEENPTEPMLEDVKRFISYWMACDTILKDKERTRKERQISLTNLLKDYDGMKNNK